MNCDPKFEKLISNYARDVLRASDNTIYGIDRDFNLRYFNEGWKTFAEQNGGEPSISKYWPVGRNILDAIPAQLQPFFRQHFAECLQQNKPWFHEYECSSPEQYRLLVMRVYPLGGEGFLVVNSPIRQSFHQSETRAPLNADYQTADGLIVQCCHCRRVRRNGDRQSWDFVTDWAEDCPVNTSHGICEPCFGFHYRPKTPHINLP